MPMPNIDLINLKNNKVYDLDFFRSKQIAKHIQRFTDMRDRLTSLEEKELVNDVIRLLLELKNFRKDYSVKAIKRDQDSPVRVAMASAAMIDSRDEFARKYSMKENLSPEAINLVNSVFAYSTTSLDLRIDHLSRKGLVSIDQIKQENLKIKDQKQIWIEADFTINELDKLISKLKGLESKVRGDNSGEIKKYYKDTIETYQGIYRNLQSSERDLRQDYSVLQKKQGIDKRIALDNFSKKLIKFKNTIQQAKSKFIIEMQFNQPPLPQGPRMFGNYAQKIKQPQQQQREEQKRYAGVPGVPIRKK